jgi:hypothetical protein
MPNEDQGRWLTYQRVGAPALLGGHSPHANHAVRQGLDDHRGTKPFAPDATLVPSPGAPAKLAFSPASNARDRAATSRFMRERNYDELVQIIAAPTKLVDWLPGFTRGHLHTSHQAIAISLAKAEVWRRGDRQPGKGLSVSVLIACLGVAVLAAVGLLLTQVSATDILDHIRALAREWQP